MESDLKRKQQSGTKKCSIATLLRRVNLSIFSFSLNSQPQSYPLDWLAKQARITTLGLYKHIYRMLPFLAHHFELWIFYPAFY